MNLRRAPLFVAPVLVALAACGPLPVEQAERSCVDNARAATGPRGGVQMGVASDGHRTRSYTGLTLSVSSDYIMGRDPAAVFDNCVRRASGQAPTRPLSAQPGWRG